MGCPSLAATAGVAWSRYEWGISRSRVPGMTTQAKLGHCQPQIGPKSSPKDRGLAGSGKAGRGRGGGCPAENVLGQAGWALHSCLCLPGAPGQAEGQGLLWPGPPEHPRPPRSSIEPGTFVYWRCQVAPWPPGLHTPGGQEAQKGVRVVLRLHPAMYWRPHCPEGDRPHPHPSGASVSSAGKKALDYQHKVLKAAEPSFFIQAQSHTDAQYIQCIKAEVL